MGVPALVIGYWTAGTPYEAEAAALRATLERFGLAHDLRPIPHRGSWQANVAYKPEFIALMRTAYPNRALLYLDADARVLAPLVYFTSEAFDGVDLAAHLFRGRELLSGTLWIGAGAGATALVEAWRAEQARRPRVWDQITLAAALGARPETRFLDLPAEYAWIDRLSERAYGDGAPRILHTRAASRLRKIVDRIRPPKEAP